MPSPGWIEQQLGLMAPRIGQGKICRRSVASVRSLNIKEGDLVAAVQAKGWKLAQMGNDYVFTPSAYTIRLIA